MRTSCKFIVLVSFVFMAVISSSAFADFELTSDGKVPGNPFVVLQQQIDNIQLIPGPAGADGADGAVGAQGPVGPAGADGADGAQGLPGECDCPITQGQLDEIYDRIEYLESLEPPQVTTRFTDMNDGTIRDNDTGLLWLKDANAFGFMNWVDAMYEASMLSSGEHGLSDGSFDGDWRLPTKVEWEAFYTTDYYNPALVNTVGDAQWQEGDAFTGVLFGYIYWSSTEIDSNGAWGAYMSFGGVSWLDKYDTFYVWPVRIDN